MKEMTCYRAECRVGKPCKACSTLWLPTNDEFYAQRSENSWLYGD